MAKKRMEGPFRCLVTERKQQQANGYSPETLGNRSLFTPIFPRISFSENDEQST